VRGLAISVFAALVFAACAPAEQKRTPADIGIDMPSDFPDWLQENYTERVLVFHDYAPMNGGVAFVGDSITEDGDWDSLYPGVLVRNYGISGDTTIGLERRLSQIFAARPAKIFLLIGTNDLGNQGDAPAEVAANYAHTLARLRAGLPEAAIFIQSVLPRQQAHAAAVADLNRRLSALAAVQGVAYIDIHTAFATPTGALDPAVTMDGLHLNASGYARWRAEIEPLVRAP